MLRRQQPGFSFGPQAGWRSIKDAVAWEHGAKPLILRIALICILFAVMCRSGMALFWRGVGFVFGGGWRFFEALPVVFARLVLADEARCLLFGSGSSKAHTVGSGLLVFLLAVPIFLLVARYFPESR